MHSVIHAPELNREGLVWFNVDRPLSLADLRGRLVILDFWTFCCINCLHILPALAAVEETYGDRVAVIGVHSPKFAAEKDPLHVAEAIARYGIRHPVIHDPEFQIWREFGVRAWPTLVFVTPEGMVGGMHSGEVPPPDLVAAIGRALADIGTDRLRPGAPLLADIDPLAGHRFRFPGKAKPTPDGVIAVADSGNHRILALSADGADEIVFGEPEPGFVDGPVGRARFRRPEGLVATEAAIYVADTGNHAIRRIDRLTGIVTTLAGTGQRGGVIAAGGLGTRTALASPWDLELRGDDLYFANAGTHQLGLLSLANGRVSVLAGAGPEGLRDGAARAAYLAQPSGLALSPDGTMLYFADSEISALRVVHLDLLPGAGDRKVETLIGTGLFDFGQRSGAFAAAQLQHPLGVACLPDGRVLIADSFNNAIRVADPTVRTLRDLDDGFECLDSICLPLFEPAGVAAMPDGRVLVTDTNNHRLVLIDPAARTLRTLA